MKFLSWMLVVLGVAGLVGVRMVEDQLFYDPFLEFFHRADKHASFPVFEWTPLIINYFFRFLLNSAFSLVVVQFLFKDKKWTLQAFVLMILVFILTLPVYLYCISTQFDVGYLFSFYMRRFVIQPLSLLLIIPLFYYRLQLRKKNQSGS